MEELNSNMGTGKFLTIIKGLVFSVVMTLIMIFVLAVVLSFSAIKENVIMPTVIFISTFSILLGGFMVSKKIDEKGIVYGSLLGLIYMVVLYLISSIMSFNFSLNMNSVIMIVLGIVRWRAWWNFRSKS